MPVKSVQQKSPIIRNLVGGLNVREAITDIADNEAAAASNVSYFTSGLVARRGAWTKLISNSPTSLPLLGTYQAAFVVANVITYYLVITDGVKIWYTADPSAVPVTWNEITGSAALDDSQPYRFQMMAGYLIIYNGVIAFYWNGTGNITAFTVPTDSYYYLTVGDITLTAVASGSSGGNITFEYVGGGTAGDEVVTVTGDAIVVEIQDNVSTSDQIVAALAANSPAMALVAAAVVTSGNAEQVSLAATPTNLVSPYVSVPISRVCIPWQNYVFWLGDAENPSRIRYSDLGDPTLYPVDNYVDCPSPYDAEPLTGGAILYGNLLCFKRFSLYILQGAPPDNLILSKLNSSVGCVEPSSVIQIDNLVYFVSDKGLYAANLFNVQQKSYKVEPRYIAAVPSSSLANPIWIANYKPKGQIFVACDCRSLYAPSQGKNDRIMCHDYFNADANGDPAVSEFFVGFTSYALSAAKPTYPTAPSIMGDYFVPGTPGKNLTVMASFYDPYVYIFQDGPIAYGGPQDNVSWLPAPMYPQSDWLSKFFDFGDPDMIKQIRWLWTTGQLYNSISMLASIGYNDSPTLGNYLDFNFGTLEVQSPNGNIWTIGVDDDGALDVTPTSDRTFLQTIIIKDTSGNNWGLSVDNSGTLDITETFSPPTVAPILVSANGYQYQLTVDPDGALNTIATYAVATVAIRPGTRVAAAPLINVVGGAMSGKYCQVYFSNIGILTQFSMDLIFKGRRA